MEGQVSRWANICSLKAGTGSVLLYEPADMLELQNCLRKLGAIPLILGHGTNFVGSDSGSQIPVLRLGKEAEFGKLLPLSEDRFRCGCAAGLSGLLTNLAGRGYGGLSGLCGIPGTLGGALAMNAGANGQEIGAVVEQIEGWDLHSERPWLWCREQGGWAYRQSPVPRGVIALHAVLQLQKVDPADEKRKLAVEHQRRKTVTPQGASAGSVFRNPAPDQPAGRLLEQAGCKGLSAGVFQVSEQHANWIVNTGRKPGTAQDCRTLTREMQQKVREQFAIELHCEWHWAE